MLLSGSILVVLLAFGLASKRGAAVGVAAGVVYALLFVPMLLSSSAVIGWSRRHPGLDGAILGPLVFLCLAYITSWPLWVCLVIGVAGTLLGATMGMRRGRLRSTQQW